MHRKYLNFIVFVVFVLPLITETLNIFNYNKNKTNTEVNGLDECCVSSKLNVAAKKANQGREFFRNLSSKSNSYKDINPQNMCNLIHFLMQQASLNNKSISFTKGMFVIFDDTNEIFGKFMKAKDEQKSGDGSEYSGYFKRLKHMGHQAFQSLIKQIPKQSDTFIYVRGDESSHFHGDRGLKSIRIQEYPAYGMDIPGACMPSGFGHILFGRLPSIVDSGKYIGERIYIKPEYFGIRQLKQFIQHAQSYLDHVSKQYVCQIKDLKTKPGCSTEEAFRESTDKNLLNQWNKILLTIPSINNQQEELSRNATKFGIREIYRQVKQIQSMLNESQINDFLSKMIQQYGKDDLNVRKGREIIFTNKQLNQSPLTCEFLSGMKKCPTIK